MIHPGDTVFAGSVRHDTTERTVAAVRPRCRRRQPMPHLRKGRRSRNQVLELAEQRQAAEAAEGAASGAVAAPVQPAIDRVVETVDDGGGVSTLRLAGLTAVVAAGAAGLFVARRRKSSTGAVRISTQVGLPTTSCSRQAPRVLLAHDVADLDWMNMELRWLVQHCSGALRQSIVIEEVQIGEAAGDRLASTRWPRPPAGWSVGRSGSGGSNRDAAPMGPRRSLEWPPVLPGLVVAGRCRRRRQPLRQSGAPPDQRDRRSRRSATVDLQRGVGGRCRRDRRAPTVMLTNVAVVGVEQLSRAVTTMDAAAAVDWSGWARSPMGR